MIKRVVTTILVALAMTPVILTSPLPEPVAIQGFTFWGDGRLEQRQDRHVLHLRGNPYEMGYQQGALLREEIRALLREYLYAQIIGDAARSHLLLRDYARRQEPHIPQGYREEMRGIADGAGVAYSDILILNTIFDVLDAPRGSNFAVWGAATTDGELLHGVNLDFAEASALARYNTITFYYPADGHSFVSVGWAGFCGVLTALNDQGLSVGVMSTPSQDVAENGLPVGFLLRNVVQYATDEESALTTIASAPRAAGYSVLISDGKHHRALAVEFSAHRYAEMGKLANGQMGKLANGQMGKWANMQMGKSANEQMNDLETVDYLIHTAHYRDVEMFALRGAAAPDDGSWAQYTRLEQLIQDNYGWLAPRKAMTFLQDQYDVVAQTEQSGPHTIYNAATLYSVVMQPGDGRLWVTDGDQNQLDLRGLRLVPDRVKPRRSEPAPIYVEFNLLHELGYR